MKPFELALLFLPFVLQGAAMFFDEFYFHRKRGLPLWERVGHPIDTLSVLISYSYLLLFHPSREHLVVYAGLCIFSCLLVTKDEFVHKKLCSDKETWLHAVLFILHPMTFLSAGILWYFSFNSLTMTTNLLFTRFIIGQIALTGLFAIYQLIYWNGVWTQKKS